MFKDNPQGQTQYEPAAPEPLGDSEGTATQVAVGPEPVAWYLENEDEYMSEKLRKEHEQLNSYTFKLCKVAQPLYSAATVEQLARERDAHKANYEFMYKAAAENKGQLAAMTQERDVLLTNLKMQNWGNTQLAASQAREQQLREALNKTMAALRHLGEIRDGKTLFEHSPIYDIETYEAWMELNAAVNSSGGVLSLPQDDTALRQWGAKLLRGVAYSFVGLYAENIKEVLSRKADELMEGKT